MDLNKDARLTFDEFKEGSKLDPTIVQVRSSLADSDCSEERSPREEETAWSRRTDEQALSLYDGLV
jgi:hypothetical protein